MHTFYTIPTDVDMEDFINDAKGISFKYHVDELSHVLRERSNKTISEAIDIYKKSSFKSLMFIVRYQDDINLIHIEIATRSEFRSVDYFIFVLIDIDKLDYFINKYHLTKK